MFNHDVLKTSMIFFETENEKSVLKLFTEMSTQDILKTVVKHSVWLMNTCCVVSLEIGEWCKVHGSNTCEVNGRQVNPRSYPNEAEI